MESGEAIGYGRREFLEYGYGWGKVFFGVAAGGVIGAAGSEVMSGVLEGLGVKEGAKAATEKVVAKFASPISNIAYSEYFEQLFLPSKRFHIATATEKIEKGREYVISPGLNTHSNEAFAIASINTALGSTGNVIDASSYEIDDNLKLSFLAVGGPITNRFATRLLGDPKRPEFYFRLDLPQRHGSFIRVETPLAYSIRQVSNEADVTRMQDGTPKSSYRYVIEDKDGRLVGTPEYDSNGRPKSDYLLVTRVKLAPGFGELISFAGIHGPSIRGISPLINQLPLGSLRKIWQTLGARAYEKSFQMILRFDQLEEFVTPEMNTGKTLAPREVSLWDEHVVELETREI